MRLKHAFIEDGWRARSLFFRNRYYYRDYRVPRVVWRFLGHGKGVHMTMPWWRLPLERFARWRRRHAELREENALLRGGLVKCAELAGADTSGGPPLWPPIEIWAAEAVAELRRDYDEAPDA